MPGLYTWTEPKERRKSIEKKIEEEKTANPLRTGLSAFYCSAGPEGAFLLFFFFCFAKIYSISYWYFWQDYTTILLLYFFSLFFFSTSNSDGYIRVSISICDGNKGGFIVSYTYIELRISFRDVNWYDPYSSAPFAIKNIWRYYREQTCSLMDLWPFNHSPIHKKKPRNFSWPR